jgi:hypothetical protein
MLTPLVGVPLAVELHAPCPTPFTAATRNAYAVPLVRPVTVAAAVVLVLSLNVVHVEPLLLEYWTT